MLKITNLLLAAFLFLTAFSCKKESVKSEDRQDSSVTEAKRNEMTSDSINSVSATEKTVSYSTFKGAWFDIEYPSTFKAENSLKSYTNSEGFDSAVFTSPDGKVQFYVFSPQWSGEPTDIKVVEGERIKETSEEKKNGLFVKRWTVEANDGSYRRSYEETSENVSHTNKVFGVKYATEADLEKYREEYLHFKNSLIQYAD